MKPWLLPSGHQQGIAFIIPDNWSPAQALAVIELIDDLRHVIGERYQLQLHELLREQRCTQLPADSDHGEKTDPPF